MIDFNTSQLTWIVIGACSLGGTGYLTVNTNMSTIDKKVEINSTKMDNVSDRVVELQAQLNRIENKLDARGNKK
jgi:outer membrane murein-binding lipoprotein Lpp